MNRTVADMRHSLAMGLHGRRVLASCVVASVFDLISFGSVIDPLRPDLTLLVVLYWSTRSQSPAPIGGAWCFGLLRDIATLTPLGLHAGLYCLTAWIGVRLRKRFEALPIPGELLLVLLTLLGGSMLSWGAGLLLGGRPSPQTHLMAPLVGTLLWPLLRVLMRGLFARRRKIARYE